MGFWSFIVLLALSLGWMLSPENLVILGQQAGAAGRWIYPGLALAAVMHFFTARVYDRGFDPPGHPGGDIRPSRTAKPSLAVVLSLAARGGFTLWGVTAVLVTAGYVFNEIFWPAYPNLGFSFTLLALLLVLNFWGPRVAGVFQVICALVALAGLAVLVVMGFLGAPGPLEPPAAPEFTWRQGLNLAPFFLFPFMGYELSGFVWERLEEVEVDPGKPMWVAIITLFCLYSLWCFISLRYVPGLKLQESTVPYAYVARAVAGETGLRVMGVVLLAGALAAANALLLATPIMVSGLPATGLLPFILRGRVFILLLFGAGIALAMGLGLGGSPNLARFLTASGLLWLLVYARQHLASWLGRDTGESRDEPGALALICTLTLAAAVVLALIVDPDRIVLGVYMLAVVVALALVSAIPCGTGKKTDRGINYR